MSNIVLSQVKTLCGDLGMQGEPQELMTVLKNTAFKGSVTDAQMAALLVVANQYSLNPWTKEIYAFPDKQNGIVPVVGVDGWSRIINENPQLDGIDFEQDDEKCTCIIYRKDRKHPVKVTEWMSECRRNMGPWNTHPKRMLRHKALIQCARLAFGFSGIYDQDEAERIVDKDMGKVVEDKPECPAELLNKATDEAELGIENFRKYWKGLEKQDRALLAQHLKMLEGVCEEADSKKEKELSAEDVDFVDSYNEAENGTTN